MAAAPELDKLIEDYIRLAFRLDKHINGLVDAYYGPETLRSEVAAEQPMPLSWLAGLAEELEDAFDAHYGLRGDFLRRQVQALRAQIADALSDHRNYDYVTLVHEMLDVEAKPVPDAQIEAYQSEVRKLLFGLGYRQEPTAAIAAWETDNRISGDGLFDFCNREVGVLRLATQKRLPYLPTKETATIEGVTDKPWGAYNWYLGNYVSRIELNLDVPMTRQSALGLLRHEIYPGHHTDHSIHERICYREQGHLEVSIKLLNTPDCPIVEGLADVGYLLLDQHSRDSQAEQLHRTLNDLRRAAGVNAALLYHQQGGSVEEAIAYRMRVSWVDERRATQAMKFVLHPLWRGYTFTYWAGGNLIEQAITAARKVGRIDALCHLLYTELLTPTMLRAEMNDLGVLIG
jgi:hypothetical protein